MSRQESTTLSRRHLLHLAGAGCLGFNLAGLLRAQATQPVSKSASSSSAPIKACIFIFLGVTPPYNVRNSWEVR